MNKKPLPICYVALYKKKLASELVLVAKYCNESGKDVVLSIILKKFPFCLYCLFKRESEYIKK